MEDDRMATTPLSSPFLPLATLDPAAPLDDLEPLAGLIGDARVVAIGESAHYAHEFYLLRDRLCRFLVERLGFSAILLESGFPEGFLADRWIHGAPGAVDEVSARGITYGFGMCEEMRAQLEWMRAHNAAGGAVSVYGIDVPGSMGSLVPSLDAIAGFVAEVDPAYLPHLARLRDLAMMFGATDPAAFSDDYTLAGLRAYAAMPASDRNELTARLADLAARLDTMRLIDIERAGVAAYDLVRQQVQMAVQTDAAIRQFVALADGDRAAADTNIRDLAMADAVEWILRRERRVIVLAHNAHIQRTVRAPGVHGPKPVSMMGHHLAARLGEEYLPIGVTCASGEIFYYEQEALLDLQDSGALRWALYDLSPVGLDTIDGLMAAARSEPGILDLRSLTPEDRPLVDAASRMRILQYTLDITSTRQAFDLLVHVPRISVWHSPVTERLLHAGAKSEGHPSVTGPGY
jgi:erythromycin esterase